jgi:RNA polymerase sigma-70 factor (ECF subfamily)
LGAGDDDAVVAAARAGEESAFAAPFAILVPRIEDGRIAELTAFHDLALFEAFALPAALPPADR